MARLTIDLGAGRNVETPSIVSDRYDAHGMPGTFGLTVTLLIQGELGEALRRAEQEPAISTTDEPEGQLGDRGE